MKRSGISQGLMSLDVTINQILFFWIRVFFVQLVHVLFWLLLLGCLFVCSCIPFHFSL